MSKKKVVLVVLVVLIILVITILLLSPQIIYYEDGRLVLSVCLKLECNVVGNIIKNVMEIKVEYFEDSSFVIKGCLGYKCKDKIVRDFVELFINQYMDECQSQKLSKICLPYKLPNKYEVEYFINYWFQ